MCGIAGHLSLAIVDLSAAATQPMTDASGRFTIVFNGEIYNHPELRTGLEGEGVRFRSRSDTEVLLEGYARWGADVLPLLNGMFAFAIWDAKERTLFLARDRFGEKPLHYAHEPGRDFRFASELKALVPPGAGRGRADPDALFRFLAFGYCGMTDGTFFEGIRLVPPASSLTLRDGRVEVRRYWSLPEEAHSPPADDGARVEAVAPPPRGPGPIPPRGDLPAGTSPRGGAPFPAARRRLSRPPPPPPPGHNP